MTTHEAPALILATQNQKKKRELLELVDSAYSGAWRVVTLDDIGLADLEIIEDKDTFEGNAQLKVDAIERALASNDSLDWAAILADDSGLCVDALGGKPGVRSARFAQDNDAGSGDADNNKVLQQKLADVPAADRGAHYLCVIAVRTKDGESFFEQGEVFGTISPDAKGEGGFGYDPYFVPTLSVGGVAGRHMAELSPDEKHSISHRGLATKKALERLSALSRHS